VTSRSNLDRRETLTAFGQRLQTGKLVRMPPATGAGERELFVLDFQYNPETITRARTGKWESRPSRRREQRNPAPQDVAARSGQGAAAMLADSETISFRAVFDATEAILAGDEVASDEGVLPQLAALEIISQGKEVTDRRGRRDAARSVRPDELLVILGRRTYPAVLTSLTITEQRFTPALVPIRAEVDLKLNVLEPTEQAYSDWIRSAFDELAAQRRHSAERVYSSDQETLTAIRSALSGASDTAST
jgi:hypothetical protein